MVISAVLGAYGYHLYLTRTTSAMPQYNEADYNSVAAYLRAVSTHIEVVRLNDPDIPLPSDCKSGYSLAGLDVDVIVPLRSCTVTVDALGMVSLEAQSARGSRVTLGVN